LVAVAVICSASPMRPAAGGKGRLSFAVPFFAEEVPAGSDAGTAGLC